MKSTLLENFYIETSSTFSVQNELEFNSGIRLNEEHPIYKGHFPQIPIAPGVCLTQIIKQILEDKYQKDLIMTHGDNIKFLAMINPKETPDLTITFSVKKGDNSLDVSAIYANNGVSFVKFKGKFRTTE